MVEKRKASLLNSFAEASSEKTPSKKKENRNSVGKGLCLVHSSLTAPLKQEAEERALPDKESAGSSSMPQLSAAVSSSSGSSSDAEASEGKALPNGRASSLGEGTGDGPKPVAAACSVTKALTPPPMPAPAKSIHSDMYNTVFALQSLGGDGHWSDYLTRVRGLWDGHMSKRLSSSPAIDGSVSSSRVDDSGGGQAKKGMPLLLCPLPSAAAWNC